MRPTPCREGKVLLATAHHLLKIEIEILRRLSMRFQGRAESIGPMWRQTATKSWGGNRATSRWTAPSPGKTTRREEHAALIVRDEFRTGYSLIGLLASRARLRFTGIVRISLDGQCTHGLSSNGSGVFSSVSHRRGPPHYRRSVAVGTSVTGRPPHRSVRAHSSAYGSYLGCMASKRTPGSGCRICGTGK